MTILKYKLCEKYGLHARPAGLLAQTANKFDSTNITVFKDGGNCASAKGLFALLGLKVEAGENISIEVKGKQVDEATEAIRKLCESSLNMTALDENTAK